MISIIIINYRQKEFTIKCVRSVFASTTGCPFEVIVVNNSPEEDLKALEVEFPAVKIITNENKGFSHANNRGAVLAKGEYLFFLNADTIVRKDFTEDFLKTFEEKKFGAAGLKLYNSDGTFQLSFGKRIDFFGEISNKKDEEKFRKRDKEFMNSVEKKFSDTTEVDWVTGAAMIVRKECFEKVGGFDESFFLYYEDAELCKRFRDEGLPNYFFPYSDIVHYKGENTNEDFSSSGYLHAKRSQLNYYRMHCSPFQNRLLKMYLKLKFSLKYLSSFDKNYLKILNAIKE